MKKLFVLFALISFLFISNLSLAQSTQVVGKIYTKAEANSLYGPVVKSIELNITLLKSIALKTPQYIMFAIKNNQLFILDNKRNVLYPQGAVISSSDVFHVYSTSLFLQLLSNGISQTASFEERNNVFTVTSGASTMEYSLLCPPYCIW
jgi:hypothetical protein